MKYEIVWSVVKKTGDKNGKPWQITSLTLKDEQGNVTENVDTFDTVINGTTLEGEITQGQYGKNFVKAKAVAGANFKSAQTKEFMDIKAKNIAQAQDRSAWMWAKTNASTLIAGTPHTNTPELQEIADKVLTLATKIYNGEPTEPFN